MAERGLPLLKGGKGGLGLFQKPQKRKLHCETGTFFLI